MANHPPFAKRSALITGAASGIGAATARWLDKQGTRHLTLIDLDAQGLARLNLSCEVTAIAGDVADPNLWTVLEPKLGQLDHAIINAGIADAGPLNEISIDDWRRVTGVNLDGAFLALATCLRVMRSHDASGSVVVVASATGIKPVPGTGAYGVTKAAVAHMARIAAAENAAHNIRVNAIAPGGVDTPIWDSSEAFREAAARYGRDASLKAMAASTPRGRFADAEEIAHQIGFLLSEDAANITGHVLVSDGGYTL